MIQIFTRTMTSGGFGRRHNIGYCYTTDEAREYCAHAGEWENGWRYKPGRGWRGPNGRAYEFEDVGNSYTGQRLSVDWAPFAYGVDNAATVTAFGLAAVNLDGANIVKSRGKVWARFGDEWRESKAKKHIKESAQ